MGSKDNIFSGEEPLTDGVSVGFSHSEYHLFPPREESCELRVECLSSDFSASRIAHAVEDADAHLLNMNVTSLRPGTGMVGVDLRVSHRDGGSVMRSLERYGYTVTLVSGGFDRLAEIGRARVGELMAQIEV